MSRSTPQMRDFAKRIINYETRKNNPAENKIADTFSDCEKLRPHLSKLMGSEGFRVLLSRAIALAGPEVLWLRAAHLKTPEAAKGLEELQAPLNPDKLLEGRVVLLAQLLGLLAAFIGENITLHLVREVWPEVPLDGLDLEARGKNETRGKNEKTK